MTMGRYADITIAQVPMGSVRNAYADIVYGGSGPYATLADAFNEAQDRLPEGGSIRVLPGIYSDVGSPKVDTNKAYFIDLTGCVFNLEEGETGLTIEQAPGHQTRGSMIFGGIFDGQSNANTRGIEVLNTSFVQIMFSTVQNCTSGYYINSTNSLWSESVVIQFTRARSCTYGYHWDVNGGTGSYAQFRGVGITAGDCDYGFRGESGANIYRSTIYGHTWVPENNVGVFLNGGLQGSHFYITMEASGSGSTRTGWQFGDDTNNTVKTKFTSHFAGSFGTEVADNGHALIFEDMTGWLNEWRMYNTGTFDYMKLFKDDEANPIFQLLSNYANGASMELGPGGGTVPDTVIRRASGGGVEILQDGNVIWRVSTPASSSDTALELAHNDGSATTVKRVTTASAAGGQHNLQIEESA